MPPRSQRRAQTKTGDGRIRVRIVIDGEEYLFDSANVTHRHELALWNQARLTYIEAFNALGAEKPAMFLLAAIVFLAQVSTGDTVTYDQVAEAISVTSTIDVEILDSDEEEDGAPEVPAAD